MNGGMKTLETFLHGGFSRLNIPQAENGDANHQSVTPNIEQRLKNLPLILWSGGILFLFMLEWDFYLKKIGSKQFQEILSGFEKRISFNEK